jgi:hypothetical protein
MKKIYEMDLFEKIETETSSFGQTEIERVPGGWNYIYTHYTSIDEESPIAMTAVFVPFNNEFQESERG